MNLESGSISQKILAQLNKKGISEELALAQIETFKRGIPFTELLRPCTLGDGIKNIDKELEKYIGIYNRESISKKIIKFVPASGAASRMFKELLSVSAREGELNRGALETEKSKESEIFLDFVDNISKFAFLSSLKHALEHDGLELDSLISGQGYKSLVEYTLGPKGLNYSNLPKGIIEFHKYRDTSRTAFEEHLVEAREYSSDSKGVSRLHFTVSPEHMDKVRGLIDSKISAYSLEGKEYEIDYSIQKPSTDTIAVDINNAPLLDSGGGVVLRPGGHGALIENLNDLDCDIAFIKNIDNVVPDYLKEETYVYKKALGGYLISIQSECFHYLEAISKRKVDENNANRIMDFIRQSLKIEISSDMAGKSLQEKLEYFTEALNRPIRVCGVVKNVGEPGGGPFWIRESNGQISKQIVESAQVDMGSVEQRAVWESSTHFNPVDIVCGLKNYKGEKFDLKKYVNPDMAFISNKSKDGVELKALELPGLWNGAMANWNSLFVEVPLITFNPVKTVLDLLRPEHQPKEKDI